MMYQVCLPGSNMVHSLEAHSQQDAITKYLQHLLGFSSGSVITVVAVQSEKDFQPTYFVNHIKLEIFTQPSTNHGQR